MPNEIQRKHRLEREAVNNDALKDSLDYLDRAHNQFGAAIGDTDLREQFSAHIGRARELVLALDH